MIRYIAKRLGLSLVTILLVATVVFFMTRILPGNVAMRYLGRGAEPEQIIEFNKSHGFDKPKLVQFWSWVTGMLKGDLGTSLQYESPASRILLPAIGYSAKLALMAFILIIPTSIGGGVIAAMNRGKPIDRIITVGGLSAAVIPEFVWAVILLLIFGVTFRIFPVTAFPDNGGGFFIQVYYLILPSISLLLVLFGYIARITRAGVIEALDSDYMRTAVLKGQPRKTAVIKHVLRNALLPTIAVIASQIPYLVGGLVAVEIVFNYPGFGSVLLAAVGGRDYPILQAGVMITSIVIVLFQLLADLLFAVLNPRIRERVSQ